MKPQGLTIDMLTWLNEHPEGATVAEIAAGLGLSAEMNSPLATRVSAHTIAGRIEAHRVAGSNAKRYTLTADGVAYLSRELAVDESSPSPAPAAGGAKPAQRERRERKRKPAKKQPSAAEQEEEDEPTAAEQTLAALVESLHEKMHAANVVAEHFGIEPPFEFAAEAEEG